MLDARTLGVSIDRPWREVYGGIWRPQDFTRWASGLSQAALEPNGERWRAQGPDGPVLVRFTGHNGFGVMDHWVDPGQSAEVYVPMRVVENGRGAEVQLTLFRQPGMSDARFEADAEWVARDLRALKVLITG